MKIILLNNVPKLGQKYDIKNVSDGYALNLLIPRGLAIAATPEALKKAEAQRAKLEGEKKVSEELMSENLKRLDGMTLTIVGKANDKGHLFAGLHRDEIAKELNSQMQIQIDPSSIQLEHPIKEVGEYDIEVKREGLPAGQAGKSAKFKMVVRKD